MTFEPHDAHPEPSNSDDFWGTQDDWSSTSGIERPAPRESFGSAVGRWWGSALGSRTETARRHGAPRQHGSDDDTRTVPLDTESDDRRLDDLDAAWDVEQQPEPVRRSGVDPLLARFGALAVIITLAVPVVLGATSDSSDDQVRTAAAAAPADDATTSSTQTPSIPPAAAAPSPTIDVAVADADQTAAAAGTDDAIPATTDTPTTSLAPASAAAVVDTASAELVTADTEPTTTDAPCGSRYELAAGDYWIRIADAADVALADLLAVNGATVDTLLSPGGSICLPAGARTPAPPPAPETSPPTTNAPPTTSRPVTTTPPATTPPATSPPATTPPATTTPPVAPPASSVTPAQAEAIIRSVWPDELEDRAVEIAMRESNLRPNVKNYCCYGLFQIYWSVHRRWLEPMGITSAADLYDPTTNARAAYALYQRSGSFGPWGG